MQTNEGEEEEEQHSRAKRERGCLYSMIAKELSVKVKRQQLWQLQQETKKIRKNIESQGYGFFSYPRRIVFSLSHSSGPISHL